MYSISYITIGAKDCGSLRTFYSSVFGWQLYKEEGELILFRLPNLQIIALYPLESLSNELGISGNSICNNQFKGICLSINVTEKSMVDDMYLNVIANGGNCTKLPAITAWGGYNTFVTDPEGNFWEFVYKPS